MVVNCIVDVASLRSFSDFVDERPLVPTSVVPCALCFLIRVVCFVWISDPMFEFASS